MTSDLIPAIAGKRIFAPRTRFSHLVHDHVPFDTLTGREDFERAAERTIVGDSASAVAITGPVGAGKSSLIAYVCAHLPDSHVALRVPVAGADDPTSTSVIAAVALTQALNDIDLEEYQREALERARADSVGRAKTPAGVRRGTLGGGPIPAQVHGELATLREQVERSQLAADRLGGLDRLITILVARNLQPVFVLEDTEAAVGGDVEDAVVEAFFNGPIRAFIREVDAPLVIAVQNHLTGARGFEALSPGMHLIAVPSFQADAGAALSRIIAHRLEQFEIDADSESVIEGEALDLLASFYEETAGSIRHALAALQSASEYAEDTGAARISAGHVRAAAADWRARYRA
jgi:CDC6/ORC-like protein